MKGQLSLEALLLVAICLALLGIALVTINSIRDKQVSAVYSRLSQNTLDDIANAADEICVMGRGNSRKVLISQYPVELHGEGQKLIANVGGKNKTRETLCIVETDGDGKQYSNVAYLWFVDSAAGVPSVRVSNEFSP